MIIEKVVTGFQSGADIGAARAARKAGVETFGWMPARFLTENGCRYHYAVEYGARETLSAEYPPRTRLNVYESDAVLWFGDASSRGGQLTIGHARVANLPCLVVPWVGSRHKVTPAKVVEWLEGLPGEGGTLMVAGNRESVSTGIGAWVEGQMDRVFEIVAHKVYMKENR